MEDYTSFKGIINRGTHLSEYDKDILCAVFGKLQQEQADVMERIQEEVKEGLRCQEGADAPWEVVTALVGKEELEDAKKHGLLEMLSIDVNREQMAFQELTLSEGGKACAGIAFLNCPYHQMEAYIDRTYKAVVKADGTSFTAEYRLRAWPAFFQQEAILERTGMQYGIKRPLLYSPMSRRAVQVQLYLGGHTFERQEGVEIDFQYQVNQLEDILLCGKTLVWNVAFLEKEQIPRPKENVNKGIVPLFDKTYQIYEFPVEEHEFIYVESEDTDLKRLGHTVYLALGNGKLPDNIRYCKIRIGPYVRSYLDQAQYAFPNFFTPAALWKERIRTQADVQYVARQFENKLFSYQGCQMSVGDHASVKVYAKRHSYHASKDKVFRSSSYCYLRLAPSEEPYFEDYVSYVMAFLNHFYPEFSWVGIV